MNWLLHQGPHTALANEIGMTSFTMMLSACSWCNVTPWTTLHRSCNHSPEDRTTAPQLNEPDASIHKWILLMTGWEFISATLFHDPKKVAHHSKSEQKDDLCKCDGVPGEPWPTGQIAPHERSSLVALSIWLTKESLPNKDTISYLVHERCALPSQNQIKHHWFAGERYGHCA